MNSWSFFHNILIEAVSSLIILCFSNLYQAQYSQLPPSLAQFSPTDPDVIVYTGYGMQKVVQFYSLTQKKVHSKFT